MIQGDKQQMILSTNQNKKCHLNVIQNYYHAKNFSITQDGKSLPHSIPNSTVLLRKIFLGFLKTACSTLQNFVGFFLKFWSSTNWWLSRLRLISSTYHDFFARTTLASTTPFASEKRSLFLLRFKVRLHPEAKVISCWSAIPKISINRFL